MSLPIKWVAFTGLETKLNNKIKNAEKRIRENRMNLFFVHHSKAESKAERYACFGP
jgi:hypothetical protein